MKCKRSIVCSGRTCSPFFVTLAIIALGLAGCGSSYEASVSGRVTLNGQPLTKGNVSFMPAADGTVANGTIDSSGNYTLVTATERGLPPGRYKVTVVATEPPSVNDGETTGTLLTPPEYGDMKTTPLEKEVVAGANVIDIAIPVASESQ